VYGGLRERGGCGHGVVSILLARRYFADTAL